MVRQRVHALALGYEDLNDHDAFGDDPVVQTACDRDQSLASSSTLCRFERRAQHQWAIAIHQQLVEQFIASFGHRPRELVLDFDATDDPVHGLKLIRFGGHADTVQRRCPMARTKLAYAPEYRRQIVELVRTGRMAKEVAGEFECCASTIRNWVRQADRDEGRREEGLTSLEHEELGRLRREVRKRCDLPTFLSVM